MNPVLIASLALAIYIFFATATGRPLPHMLASAGAYQRAPRYAWGMGLSIVAWAFLRVNFGSPQWNDVTTAAIFGFCLGGFIDCLMKA